MGKQQSFIPFVDDKPLVNLKLSELKKHASAYFQDHLRDRKVKNVHKGITVEIRRSGFRHLLHARNAGYVKIKAVFVLESMIRNAIYCNFNEPDSDDGPGVLGYFNFKCKANIEGKNHNFRIVVRLTKDGKFYYDHSVKVQK